MKKTEHLSKKKALYLTAVLIFLLVSTFFGVSQINQVKEFFSKASDAPANIYIDTRAILGPLNRSWQNLAQGGEDHAWRIAPIQDKVAALNPQYIRIDHVYDFYNIVQGTPGNITFNFDKFDLILNDILAVGAKPFLSLSYMPPAISRGDIVDQPQNWSDWQLTVQKTIEHVSGTLGIDHVYYEVWNEPDLFGSWKYYGHKNYLTLYKYAALGAQTAAQNSAVKTFKIGGPATTALYRNWFNALADYTLENNLRYDFFSWHHYNHDLDHFQNDIRQIKAWVMRYPRLRETLEIHVTEWGPDSENHTGYDNNYGAAHTVAGAIVLNSILDKAFIFEIQDGKDGAGQSYWGRWGLLTHSDSGSQPKPRYYSLLFLDRISDQRLQITGQGSWVKAIAARNPAGNTEFIMANTDEHNAHNESVPITFEKIDPGSYALNLEFLDGRKQGLNLATTSAVLTTVVPMKPNTVVYGELIKK